MSLFLLWGRPKMAKHSRLVKKGSRGTQKVNLSVFGHLGPLLGPFAPYEQNSVLQRCFRARSKTMRTSCLGGLSIMWVPKLLLTPVKLGFLAQKLQNFAQNCFFLPTIGIFGPFGPMADQKTMRKRCFGVFISVVWVTKLFLPPIKIRIFGPKKGQIWPKICFLGHI